MGRVDPRNELAIDIVFKAPKITTFNYLRGNISGRANAAVVGKWRLLARIILVTIPTNVFTGRVTTAVTVWANVASRLAWHSMKKGGDCSERLSRRTCTIFNLESPENV
jgi:hypothetical protein